MTNLEMCESASPANLEYKVIMNPSILHKFRSRHLIVGIWFVLALTVVAFGSGIMACFFITILGIVIILFSLRSFVPADDFKFLAMLCICSFLLRVSLAFILHPWAQFFGPDAAGYDRRAWLLAQNWRSGDVALSGRGGYDYLVMIVYVIFGHTPIGAKVVNGILGTHTAVFIYLIARDIFGRKVARTSFVLVAFFPSLLLWSSLMLKDALVMFMITLTIWSAMKLHRRFRIRYVVIILASMAYLTNIRYYIASLIMAAIISSFLVQPLRRLIRSIFVGLVLAILFAVVWQYALGNTEGHHAGYPLDLARINDVRQGFAGGGSKFLGDVRIESYMEALKFMPLGFSYFFLGPFPWQIKIHRPLQVMAVPEVLIWYFLLPFMIYGFAYTLRNSFGRSYPIIIYVSILTLAYTLTITNMGSLYRFRAQMLIFYFIFVGVGIVRFRNRRRLRIAGRS